MTAVTVDGINGAAMGAVGAGRASAGTQTPQMMAASMFSDYPAIAASGQYATMGAVSGLMAGDGIVTRAVQTDLAYIAGAGEGCNGCSIDSESNGCWRRSNELPRKHYKYYKCPQL